MERPAASCADCPLRDMPPDWTSQEWAIEFVRFDLLHHPEDPAIVLAMPGGRSLADALAKDRPERCRQLAKNLPPAPKARKRSRPLALCPEVRAVDYAVQLGLITWPEDQPAV